jgi:hypothetical protein
MKCTFAVNGKIELALTPENDLEKMMLQELFKTEVESQFHEKIQIFGKALVDTVTITKKQKDDKEKEKVQTLP